MCVCLGGGVLLGERGVTEREFTVDWLGISGFLLYVGLHSRGDLGGVLLGGRGVTEREFTVYCGEFWWEVYC